MLTDSRYLQHEMHATLSIIACFVLASLVACETSPPVSKESSSASASRAQDVIPPYLAGEWKVSKGKTWSGICLWPDGQGVAIGGDDTDVIGFKVFAAFDAKSNTITFTTRYGKPSEPDTTHLFDYNPSARTLTSRNGDWGTDPFKRIGPKIPREIAEMIEEQTPSN